MCTGSHPYIPAADTVKVEMVYQGPGGVMVNDIYFSDPTGWVQEDLGVLAQNMRDWWVDSLKPHMSNQMQLNKVRVTDLSSETAGYFEYSTDLPQTGGYASGILPSNVTAAIKFSTAKRGRSYRGRNYIVGIAEGHVDGDTLNPAFITDFTSAYNALDDGAVIEKGHQVVVSYCQNGVWLTDAVVTPVNARSLDNTIDSQRRRLLHRGQ